MSRAKTIKRELTEDEQFIADYKFALKVAPFMLIICWALYVGVWAVFSN